MRNLTLMTDLYQLTMMDGYLKCGTDNRRAVFDLFFRPKDEIGYAVFAGLEQALDYIRNLHFSAEDIAYLKGLDLFSEAFLKRLEGFRFSGNIYSVEEGRIVFPYEPILSVEAPIFEAQLVETALLNIINHQTLIATKASRVTHVAGSNVMEFGLRRAQGPDAGIYGARAAMIGGCNGTSNVLAGQMFDIPVKGTHAHSFVMSFASELEAFRAYADLFPDNCLLLVDTYDTLKSGVPNAIRVFRELREKGHEPVGIRLDSGDLAYLSKKARKMLDEAGFPKASICASGDLDEHSIVSLRSQGARIDSWGIGTKLITSETVPSLGGVYKLAAVERDGRLEPVIKISENPVKITNPGFKKILRIYDGAGMAQADLICLKDEEFDTSEPLTIFHPTETWKRTTFTDYRVEPLLKLVCREGEVVYQSPSLREIMAFAANERETFWDEYRRIEKPQVYKVDLSRELYELKQRLLSERHGEGL